MCVCMPGWDAGLPRVGRSTCKSVHKRGTARRASKRAVSCHVRGIVALCGLDAQVFLCKTTSLKYRLQDYDLCFRVTCCGVAVGARLRRPGVGCVRGFRGSIFHRDRRHNLAEYTCHHRAAPCRRLKKSSSRGQPKRRMTRIAAGRPRPQRQCCRRRRLHARSWPFSCATTRGSRCLPSSPSSVSASSLDTPVMVGPLQTANAPSPRSGILALCVAKFRAPCRAWTHLGPAMPQTATFRTGHRDRSRSAPLRVSGGISESHARCEPGRAAHGKP